MADRGEKLQQLHCYHPFSDSRDTYLTKNHYENYSPKMVPTNSTGSWTNTQVNLLPKITMTQIYLIFFLTRNLSTVKSTSRLFLLIAGGSALRRRHNERDGVSHHRRLDYLLNRLFRRGSKKTSKLHANGLCEGNSPLTGVPAQRADKAENVSI